MSITVREYGENDINGMISVWNEVVRDGVAFPQTEELDFESGKKFFAEQTCCPVATDENGEFVMDVDKKYPTIDFRYSGNKTCEVALELNQARGAVWVGDVVCSGLSSWAAVTQTG